MVGQLWSTGREREIGEITLACTDGGIIKAIDFASWGTPTGRSCAPGGFEASKACNSRTAAASIAAQCIGRSACIVSDSVAALGEPCLDVAKRLALVVSGCVGNASTNVPPPPPPLPPSSSLLFTYAVEIPTGATAEVFLPAMGRGAGNVTAGDTNAVGAGGESGTFWVDGQYLPGVPGVISAAVSATSPDEQELVVVVGSGAYTFVVRK